MVAEEIINITTDMDNSAWLLKYVFSSLRFNFSVKVKPVSATICVASLYHDSVKVSCTKKVLEITLLFKFVHAVLWCLQKYMLSDRLQQSI